MKKIRKLAVLQFALKLEAITEGSWSFFLAQGHEGISEL